jgi:CheY-like chemotaxis protein
MRAAALVHRLLAFSRQQDLAPKPISLNQIARDMVDMIRRTVGAMVQVDLQLADGQWLVLCDPNQLESALLNLCVNARDAMPEGGWLTICTEELLLSEADVADQEDARPGRYAAIAVSDTGTGMPPEIVAHVFEPFFTTKPSGQGTGLGLSQIYGFVRQSGGLVQIETSPGKGTTVRLCLPFHELDPNSPAATDPAISKTVLLVEDELGIRQLTAELLRDQGYRVLEAESGAAVLRLIQTGVHIDLLISDYGLPGSMNGRQVIDAVHERNPELPAILITGYADAAQMAGLEVIRKPFDPAVLIDRVTVKLDEPGASPRSEPTP